MVDPARGPFLFDTSAESWLARNPHPRFKVWFEEYLSQHRVHTSAVTVVERIRGYGILAQRAGTIRRAEIDAARIRYLATLGPIWPVDGAVGIVAGEIMALVPDPPTSPKRTHRQMESRQDRLVRWRFDGLIAATALVSGLSLIHNNASDFETIRGAIERTPDRFPGLGPLELIRCESLA